MIRLFGDTEFANKTLMFVRGDKSLRTIPDLLGDKAEVSELVVYRSADVIPDPAITSKIRDHLTRGEIDWMCFFSPSGIDALLKNFDPEKLRDVKTAAIGETTAGRARAAGLNVNFISRRTRAEDFADDLIEYIKNIA
jgi:uroporphyrinogen-III synthase